MDITIFNNPQFGDVRTAGTAENPMFCAIDVARALGYSNPAKAIIDHCKGVTILETPTKGGVQNVKFISEPEVYRLIFKSNAPNAEKFNSWFAEDVLPSIRQHGAYMSDKVIERTLTDPDYLIQLATTLKDERKARHEAEERAARLRVINEKQHDKIVADKPKVLLADAIIGSQSSILIGQMAKILTQNGYKIGQNKLFQWLRDNHYLCSYGSNYNIPYQVYIDQGLFEVKYTVHSENERLVTSATTKVTTKGLQYFLNKFLKVDDEYEN